MERRELEFDLPDELIAQSAIEPRDHARLLGVHRATAALAHRQVRDLPELLNSGDCLVLNDTRVVPARFWLRRASGGRVEGLFLSSDGRRWEVLLKGAARVKLGERLAFNPGADFDAMLIARGERGAATLELHPTQRDDASGAAADTPAVEVPVAETLLEAIGEIPLPPYIDRPDGATTADAARYQTVYARQAGSVAAPTAGLHFTDALFRRLSDRGVETAQLTLHVGLGTFQPIEVDDLARHAMHTERFRVTRETLNHLSRVRQRGGRIVAVGTTSLRTLETLAARGIWPGSPASSSDDSDVTGETDIFIYPPHNFAAVDALLTNFHLPGSTLIALVMAFAGIDLTRTAYATAIAERYRFYSYGDAMLIL